MDFVGAGGDCGSPCGDSRVIDETVEPVDILKKVGSFSGNNATAVKDRKTGALTITVESPDDPYVNFGGRYGFSADSYGYNFDSGSFHKVKRNDCFHILETVCKEKIYHFRFSFILR